jgi:hypothetical protein
MCGSITSAVDRYLELSNVKRDSLKKVSTPCIDDHLIPAEDFTTKGHLSAQASKIVLKALYAARLARPDLLWTVNALAREVTKWTIACDKRLHRLMSYMVNTPEHVLRSHLGDELKDCKLYMFVDASFAGDLTDSKSTSGMILCLCGPNTFCPLSWICKKQGAVSHSSTESEIISMDAGMRMEALPALGLWDLALEVFHPLPASTRPKREQNPNRTRVTDAEVLSQIDHVPTNVTTSGRGRLVILEDNDAVIKMCQKQRSPNMRHVSRTHRVDLDWLFERISFDDAITMTWVNTKQQAADIFTKGSFSEATWKTLLGLIQLSPMRK